MCTQWYLRMEPTCTTDWTDCKYTHTPKITSLAWAAGTARNVAEKHTRDVNLQRRSGLHTYFALNGGSEFAERRTQDRFVNPRERDRESDRDTGVQSVVRQQPTGLPASTSSGSRPSASSATLKSVSCSCIRRLRGNLRETEITLLRDIHSVCTTCTCENIWGTYSKSLNNV